MAMIHPAAMADSHATKEFDDDEAVLLLVVEALCFNPQGDWIHRVTANPHGRKKG